MRGGGDQLLLRRERPGAVILVWWVWVWGLPYLTRRIDLGHNYEHVFDFSRNPRTDARPLPEIGACYGSPWEFPGEDYPGWPEETEPDPSHFVKGGGPG